MASVRCAAAIAGLAFIVHSAPVLGAGHACLPLAETLPASAADIARVSINRSLAERGDAKGQILMGDAYLRGRGVPQDIAEGERLYRRGTEQFRRLAEKGDYDAQFTMALIYSNGLGVQADPSEAFRWFRLAAEQGEWRAESQLGDAYAHGVGIERDYAQAAGWYAKAAKRGDMRSLFLQGTLYLNGGPGLEADVDKGGDMILAAARAGYRAGYTYLGRFFEGEFGGPVDEVLAREAYMIGAVAGDARAQYRHGLSFYRGDLGQTKDSAHARGWFRDAADQDYADAQALLADIYARGDEIWRDPVEALKWGLLACRGEDSPGVELRRGLMAELRETEIAEARQMAEDWLRERRKNPDTAIILLEYERERDAYRPPTP